MAKCISEADVSPHRAEDFPDRKNRFYLYCPGCYEAAKVKHPDEPRWWMNSALHCFSSKVHQFNGDMDKPTLSPSLLCSFGGDSGVCHSYVRDGKIQFLGDCTHPLANKTVDLLDVPPIDAPVQEESHE